MIRLETITVKAAELGPNNPLPDIMNNTYIHAGYQLTDAITAEESENIGRGMLSTLLPYLAQDGYTRERKEKEFKAIILENRFLKAVFLPSLGGRLWQLYDKIGNRELLYVNPVFQPCNLALRNAWFSGGVEFNVGIKGHNPLTCSPMFAQVREDENGNEILSMYEYERIRAVTYSINAWLPKDSPVLYIRNVIENTAPSETYMYWWSNIAARQTEHTRVLVPTGQSFVSYYGEDNYVLDKTSIPYAFDTDVSYPANINRSLDFFYKIPPEHPKWIAAVEKDGKGLLHFSESILKGRKLFLWGQGNGGKHWGEFLAGSKVGEPESGEGYIEIQAGLAHTQYEHFIMPANSEIAFTECYAPLDADPNNIHSDWNTATAEVERQLAEYTGGLSPDKYLENLFPLLQNTKIKRQLHIGSGWGELENEVRSACGHPTISRYFGEWANPDCKESLQWKTLLHTGSFSDESKSGIPMSYVIDSRASGEFWRDKLAEACRSNPEDSRYPMYLGVTLYAKGRKEAALENWKTAAKKGNAYAWRNLAAYYSNEKHDYHTAADMSAHALELQPDNHWLALDYSAILCASGDAGLMQRFLDSITKLSERIQSLPRMRLLKVRALLFLNRPEEAMPILTENFTMPDIKEGELSVSALWTEMHIQYLMKKEKLTRETAVLLVKERYPLPYSLDFRMHE